MSRFFSAKYEYRSMLQGIHNDLTRFTGTRVYWYRLDSVNTRVDDVYDMGVGRDYRPPFPIDAVQAVRTEGPLTSDSDGLFTRDTVELHIAWDEIERCEMTDIMTNTDKYLKDRFVYDDVTFTPRRIEVAGQIRNDDTIVRVVAQEVRSDETHYDPAMDPYQ